MIQTKVNGYNLINPMVLVSGHIVTPIGSGLASLGTVALPFSSGHFTDIRVSSIILNGTPYTTLSSSSGTFGNFNYKYNETPAGSINNVNTSFTLTNAPSNNSVSLIKNGIFLTPVTDYTLSSNIITMVSAPLSGTSLNASYQYITNTGIGLYTYGTTNPGSTQVNSLVSWGDTTGTNLKTNSGIFTDGNGSMSFVGNISGVSSGVSSIGTPAKTFSGVYADNVVSPNSPKMWVNFSGVGVNGPASIYAGYGVSAVNRTAAGEYDIKFAVNLPDTRYGILATNNNNNTTDVVIIHGWGTNTKTVSGCHVRQWNTVAATDVGDATVVIYHY